MATSRRSSDPLKPNLKSISNKNLKTTEEQDRDSASDFRNWAEIQRDVLVAIFEKIGMIGVLSSADLVCSLWRKAAKEEFGLWRRIHMGMDDEVADVNVIQGKLELMAKKAVDRSKGGLEEFWIGRFCSDTLLRYTGARACNLKSLRLVACEYISDYTLVDALQNMKQLEELELTYCRFRVAALEAIGRVCPLLLCFKLKEVAGVEIPGESVDEEAAIGISKTMHQLRYLQLFGGWCILVLSTFHFFVLWFGLPWWLPISYTSFVLVKIVQYHFLMSCLSGFPCGFAHCLYTWFELV